jgi:hypothetical protein
MKAQLSALSPARRHVLSWLAVLGVGALLRDGYSFTQQTTNPRRMDVHHPSPHLPEIPKSA